MVEVLKVYKKDDLLNLKDDWKTLELGEDMTVFQSFEWNQLLVQEWENSGYDRLFSKIVIFKIYNNENKILVPLLVQKISTKFKWLGRKRGVYLLGIGSYSDYLNIIYQKYSKELVQEFIVYMKRKYSGYHLYITDVIEDTEFGKDMSEKYGVYKKNISAYIQILNNSKTYTASLSKHTRQNLRTALNRMERDEIRYTWLELGLIKDERLLSEMLEVHINRAEYKCYSDRNLLNRYGNRLYRQFLVNKEKNNNIVFNSMRTMENSIAVIVKLNQKVVGYIYGLVDKNDVVRIMHNCVDEKYGFYSPMFRGIYDFILSCNDNGRYSIIDFTRGDEDYKFKLGAESKTLISFKIVE